MAVVPGSPGPGQLAPWPNIDRYPTVIGSNLTLTYLSSVFRLSQTGYRQQYVDVLDELLERDGHAFAVLSQRILGVAGARMSFEPAKCDESEAEKAREIAADCEAAIMALPERRESLAALLWGIYYGVSAAEIEWSNTTVDSKWMPIRLHWIHSRRLAYPDPRSWNVRIWDLGMVESWSTIGKDPTSQLFGISPQDFPGKFIIHSPQLRGDYPTRDGLGRECAYWMAIKLMGARSLSNFVERFGKPWPIGYYRTTDEEQPRAATDDDKIVLDVALKGIGAGSLGSATLPDSVKIGLDGPTSGTLPTSLPQAQLIELCNAETSKAVLGQTDTVEASSNGSRAATETRKDGTLELYRYDAACLCDTLKRDLVWWYVHLNYPGLEHLTPTPKLDVEPPPDRKAEAAIGLIAVQMGMPVDADKMAAKIDVPLVDKDDPEARRCAWVKQVDISQIDDSFEPPAPPVPPGGAVGEQEPGADEGAKPPVKAKKPKPAKPAKE
jgi:phage gp29-like protein